MGGRWGRADVRHNSWVMSQYVMTHIIPNMTVVMTVRIVVCNQVWGTTRASKETALSSRNLKLRALLCKCESTLASQINNTEVEYESKHPMQSSRALSKRMRREAPIHSTPLTSFTVNSASFGLQWNDVSFHGVSLTQLLV